MNQAALLDSWPVKVIWKISGMSSRSFSHCFANEYMAPFYLHKSLEQTLPHCILVPNMLLLHSFSGQPVTFPSYFRSALFSPGFHCKTN